jgi:hypothetical protein
MRHELTADPIVVINSFAQCSSPGARTTSARRPARDGPLRLSARVVWPVRRCTPDASGRQVDSAQHDGEVVPLERPHRRSRRR